MLFKKNLSQKLAKLEKLRKAEKKLIKEIDEEMPRVLAAMSLTPNKYTTMIEEIMDTISRKAHPKSKDVREKNGSRIKYPYKKLKNGLDRCLICSKTRKHSSIQIHFKNKHSDIYRKIHKPQK